MVTRVALITIPNIKPCRSQPRMPSFHFPCISVTADSGRTVVENRKSVTARFTTNALGIVLSDFSFQIAMNTSALPQAPNNIKEHVTAISTATWKDPRVGRENCDIVEWFIPGHLRRSKETHRAQGISKISVTPFLPTDSQLGSCTGLQVVYRGYVTPGILWMLVQTILGLT